MIQKGFWKKKRIITHHMTKEWQLAIKRSYIIYKRQTRSRHQHLDWWVLKVARLFVCLNIQVWIFYWKKWISNFHQWSYICCNDQLFLAAVELLFTCHFPLSLFYYFAFHFTIYHFDWICWPKIHLVYLFNKI